MYRLRFLIAADLRKSFRPFGGLGPQLSHLSTALHLAIAESVGAALSYRRLVCLKLQEKARKRPTQASDFALLLAAESFTLGEQAKKEVFLAIESDQRSRDRPVKGKGKGVCPTTPANAENHSTRSFEAPPARYRSRSPRNNAQANNNGNDACVALRRNDNNQGFRQTPNAQPYYGPRNGQKGQGRRQARL